MWILSSEQQLAAARTRQGPLRTIRHELRSVMGVAGHQHIYGGGGGGVCVCVCIT